MPWLKRNTWAKKSRKKLTHAMVEEKHMDQKVKDKINPSKHTWTKK